MNIAKRLTNVNSPEIYRCIVESLNYQDFLKYTPIKRPLMIYRCIIVKTLI